MLDGLAAGDKKDDPGWMIGSVDDPGLSDDFQDSRDQRDVAEAQQRLADAEKSGLFVEAGATGSPADKAQLEYGDVITTVKDTPVSTVADLCDVLQSAAPGEKLPLQGMYTVNAGEYETTDFGDEWTTDLVLPNK
ncbi:PDZ domain-containing protein [Streptomyces sp. NPDC051636]|uniref:PDZ domain-containing protein n=1 Tax=Streptomyces sp. NPDC051636 TaxID=3365663 RepID=UPI00378935BA